MWLEPVEVLVHPSSGLPSCLCAQQSVPALLWPLIPMWLWLSVPLPLSRFFLTFSSPCPLPPFPPVSLHLSPSLSLPLPVLSLLQPHSLSLPASPLPSPPLSPLLCLPLSLLVPLLPTISLILSPSLFHVSPPTLTPPLFIPIQLSPSNPGATWKLPRNSTSSVRSESRLPTAPPPPTPHPSSWLSAGCGAAGASPHMNV